MKICYWRYRDVAGFTLVELMIVIAIIAALTGIAIPGFSAWIPNYHLKSAAQDIYSNFQLAKLTAVKRNTNCTVVFKKLISGTTYDYVVFVDSNRDLEYNTGDEVVTKRSFEEYKGNVFFDPSDGLDFGVNDNTPPLSVISFRSNGLVIDNDGNNNGGTVSLKNIKNREMDISVSSTGNIRIL